jgi:hypothetical protein
MKMTKEHYGVLEEAIREVINKYPDMQQAYKEQGFSSMRYRWDLYHSINRSRSFKIELYTYLNDNHIDTALKRITGTK